jgi:hypothetical protein
MVDKISQWFEHIQTPREQLGNMPICPFAKAAIANNQYTIAQCTIDSIDHQVQQCDISTNLVHILYLPTYEQYTTQQLDQITNKLNQQHIKDNKVVLENEPRITFELQGIRTTFPHCFLWIVQSLSDLTQKSDMLKNTNYYSYWTKEQIDEVVTWRTIKSK